MVIILGIFLGEMGSEASMKTTQLTEFEAPEMPFIRQNPLNQVISVLNLELLQV